MPISENHRNLFQNSSTLDKLNLFQTLLDSGSLTSEEALALLNTIHAELGRSEAHNRSVYIQYAQVMESLRVKMPKIHEDISANWQKLRSRLQTKTDEVETFEDDEPRRKNETVEKLPSKPPQKIDVNKGIDNRGGSQESEFEEMESGESEAEEMEGEEKEEDEVVVVEKEEVEESEEKEETEEGEEPEESEEEETEEGEEKEEEKESEEEKEEEKDIEEETEEKEEENKEEEETEEEEKEESKDEEVEEDEKEESEKESSELENIKEEHDSREEADHMAMEAAEAAEHSEHAEIEMEIEPLENEASIQPPMDIEETDSSIDEEEGPPMEMPES